jgi:transposase-like protein
MKNNIAMKNKKNNKSKHRHLNSAIKGQVVAEVLWGEKELQDVAAEYNIQSVLVSKWVKHALEIMKDSIPSKEDICRYGMPEEEYAVEHFYGKDVEEASELFFIYPEYYESDLRWMGVKAYFYYIHSIKRYLQSNEGRMDDIFIHNIISTLHHRLQSEARFRRAFQYHKDSILEILTLIKAAINDGCFHPNDAGSADIPCIVSHLIELCKK